MFRYKILKVSLILTKPLIIRDVATKKRCKTLPHSNEIKKWPCNQKGRTINRQNLNEYLETIHLSPTQFCQLPGFYHKIEFLRSLSLSLHSNRLALPQLNNATKLAGIKDVLLHRIVLPQNKIITENIATEKHS